MKTLLLLLLSATCRAGGLEQARALSWSGHYEESLDQYRALLSSSPGDASLRTEYAEVLAWAGRHDESLREIDAVLETRPEDERAWLIRARALAWSGRHEKALVIYDRYPEKTQLERAALVGWMGNKLQSDKLLRNILQGEPDNVGAHLALADMHTWVGDYRTAGKHYAEAVALSSANVTAQRGLRQLREAKRPGITALPTFFSNSKGFRREGAFFELWLHPVENLALAPVYGRLAFRQKGQNSIESDAGGLALRWQHRLRLTLEGEAIANTYDTGPAVVSGRFKATGLVFERTNVWAGYDRADIYDAGREVIGRFDESTLDAVRQRVQLDDAFVGVFAEPWKLRLLGELRWGDYVRSDNERRTALAQALLKALPFLDAGYQFYWVDAARRDPLYFSPNGYNSHGFIARLHRDANGFSAELSNNVFYQPQSRSWGDSPQAALRLRRGRAEASLEGYYLVSDIQRGPRFISRHLVARLTCRF